MGTSQGKNSSCEYCGAGSAPQNSEGHLACKRCGGISASPRASSSSSSSSSSWYTSLFGESASYSSMNSDAGTHLLPLVYIFSSYYFLSISNSFIQLFYKQSNAMNLVHILTYLLNVSPYCHSKNHYA